MRKTRQGIGPLLALATIVLVVGNPLPPSGWSVASVNAAGVGPNRHVVVRQAVGPVESSWGTASIFWFGRATENENYVDVRVAYDSQALSIFATVVDYYLWWDANGASDPRQYEALAVYFDTSGSPGASPQSNDYFFASGFRWYPSGNDSRWHRQGRGTGSGWDEAAGPTAWTDSTGARWYNSGPNSNSDRDGGWATTITIPWTSLGFSGPPAPGTVWNLGASLHDRDDQPPAGAAPVKSWPETFSADVPSTWGVLAFDPPAYQPPQVTNQQTTAIRRGMNGTVEDATVGGGSTCGGGIYGGGDTVHPTGDLFVQNQADVADFPCFSKTYAKFSLGAIPPGKTVSSATLQLYQFGSSDPTEPHPSLLQVFAVADDWSESTVTWNNAPLAAENYAGTWVNPTDFTGWPGIKVTWDVSKLVADANAAGKPANLVLYSADTNYHSGRYFTGSEVEDWDAVGRPTLTVVWGDLAPNPYQVILPVIRK